MLSSDRRHILKLLAALPLAGCGFAPVYGTEGTGRTLRGRIAYRAPATPEGFRLRTRLEDRLGRVEQGDYLLTVQMSIGESALAISSAQSITRFNLPGTATWVLSEPGNDTPLAQGTASTFTAYSAAGTTIATREAQDDARDRLAIALADLIVTDIIIASAG
ncbi:LPS assembly lipoprotein LptE [uncultured Maritalea sp.]|uniref:LPS assembly lipoprotein LptE n=1 Tax=uncultured Maritalea sp. TaxID=757249 RepID=UPI0026047566|nr:LPS assembly lipoprotein LptE [uncultured Maritalea sp.]